MKKYDKKFYDAQKNGSIKSAEEMVPYIMGLFQLHSVIDVGCGIGTWLSVFKKNGIDEIMGVDGQYVDLDSLAIPKENFSPQNIVDGISASRKYDLVLCLEVAEHLPAQCSATLIENLVRLGDIVAFSAAIPGQGGTNHINEQWQEYWADLFIKEGYIPIDLIRKQFWNNSNVEVWYKQNMILYVKREMLEKLHIDKLDEVKYYTGPLSIVHPELFLPKGKYKIARDHPYLYKAYKFFLRK